MKYIIFSFDDGRADQFNNGYAVLKKYGFPATINVVSDFVDGIHAEPSFGETSVTWDNLYELQNSGWEIACHGATHENTVDDIRRWLNNPAVRAFSMQQGGFGFASPGSYLTKSNSGDIMKLVESGELLYIRSGKQVRREGLWYAVRAYLNRKFPNKKLFYTLNRDSILIKPVDNKRILQSIGIVNSDTVEEIQYFADKMPDESAVILMLHSITATAADEARFGVWGWSKDKLDGLCSWIADSKDISVITTREWVMG